MSDDVSDDVTAWTGNSWYRDDLLSVSPTTVLCLVVGQADRMMSSNATRGVKCWCRLVQLRVQQVWDRWFLTDGPTGLRESLAFLMYFGWLYLVCLLAVCLLAVALPTTTGEKWRRCSVESALGQYRLVHRWPSDGPRTEQEKRSAPPTLLYCHWMFSCSLHQGLCGGNSAAAAHRQ